MIAVVCEMCGSHDIEKQGRHFVCQNCGTKYYAGEAIKLLVEIDNTKKLNNFYKLARRARENNEYADAEKYYGLIRDEDADSWEAAFYVMLCRGYRCRPEDIATAAQSISNCIQQTFELIQNNVSNDDERIDAVEDVCSSLVDIYGCFQEAINQPDVLEDDFDYKQAERNIDGILAELCEKLWIIFDHKDDVVFTSVGLLYVKEIVRFFSKKKPDPILGFTSSVYLDVIHRYDPSFTVEPDIP